MKRFSIVLGFTALVAGLALAGQRAARADEAYELTIAPAKGQTLSLAKLTFRAFFQNGGGLLDPRAAAIAYQVRGAASFSAPMAARGKAASTPSPFEVDLSNVAQLQVAWTYPFGDTATRVT